MKRRPSAPSSVPAIVYIFTLFGSIFLCGIAALCFYSFQALQIAATSPLPVSEAALVPFREQGMIRAASTNSYERAFVFDYARSGEATTTVSLVFNVDSRCIASNGTLPCMAMSSNYDAAFGARPIVIEGVRAQEEVIVDALRVNAF